MSAGRPEALRSELLRLDKKGYKAYKILQGTSWDFAPFILKFEHVQGDPFASPSRLSLSYDLEATGIPDECYDSPLKKLGTEDFLLRALDKNVSRYTDRVGASGRSGEVAIQCPGQKILRRSSVIIEGNRIRIILFAGLPAKDRRIFGEAGIRLYLEWLPQWWRESLIATNNSLEELRHHLRVLEDYHALRDELEDRGWVAFVSDGSLLPRASGVSDAPLENAVAFRAPEDLSATVDLPHQGSVRGMPIAKGVTLIVGGGFHGKTTLLKALQDAVYPHIPGDGRERVATDPSAVKIRAEDGRCVWDVDISGFMGDLPSGTSSKNFSTVCASGSTSQAVNMIEALEAGSRVLLMDEDTCATNLMIRDSRMRRVVAAEREPITPLVDRIEEIRDRNGISFILVMGGSGDYFETADGVIAMDQFQPKRMTERVREVIRDYPLQREERPKREFPDIRNRKWGARHLSFQRGNKSCLIQIRGSQLHLGKSIIEAQGVEQIVEQGQLEACGWIIRQMVSEHPGDFELSKRLRQVFEPWEKPGWENTVPINFGNLTLPRFQDVLAVLNRLR